MSIKRLIGGVAIVGVVGASTLGIGAGIAGARPAASSSGPAVVQPVDWHGGGHGWGGHGWGHGGWHGGWGWHPWGWPWDW